MATEKSKVGASRRKTGGRKKGTPNKTTALLKDAIIEAATKAGNKEGLVGYLTRQADENPAAFMTLLGKVLPMQVTGENGGPVKTTTRVELIAVSTRDNTSD